MTNNQIQNHIYQLQCHTAMGARIKSVICSLLGAVTERDSHATLSTVLAASLELAAITAKSFYPASMRKPAGRAAVARMEEWA